MKTQTLLFLFCLSALLAQAKPTIVFSDTAYCLKIKGKITSSENRPVKVELLENNHTLITYELGKGKKKFEFLLSPGSYYTIKISSLDTYEKLICFDTRQFELTEYELYEFSFETSLQIVQPETTITEELSCYPIAIVYYDKKQDKFDYNKAYTASKKKEMLSLLKTESKN